MPSEKINALLHRLIEKTEAGTLRWKEGVRFGTYQLTFADYSVIVEGPVEQVQKSIGVGYALRILDKRGETAVNVSAPDQTTASVLRSEGEQATVDARKVQRLIEAAKQSIFGIQEKVVDDLLAKLN